MENSDKVPELTNGEFEEFIKEGVVVVDFFADWCMPCLMMAPILEEVSENIKGQAKIAKVNVEDNATIAQKFNISSIPNFVVFKDGKQVDQMVGSISAEDLEDKIKAHL